MNILILSVGTRNKIVQYFKRTLTKANGERLGNIIATDMSDIAPAVYEADKFYQVPRMTENGYIETVLEICKREKITGVLSLIDPELSLLAQNMEAFAKMGVTVIGSNYRLCEMSLDKMQMYNFCVENRFKCAKSWDDKAKFYDELENETATFPVFVKPIRGSASIAISKVYDKETVDLLFEHAETPLMIQEFLAGQEIGADCYIDMISGEVVSIFTKKKIVMRAGETDKAVSFKEDKLFEMITEFIKKAGYRGPIDIDIFDVDGDYYISEVNPRFGGGYPHAYECGVDHIKKIIRNLEGKINDKTIGDYKEGIYMMKYNEIMIR